MGIKLTVMQELLKSRNATLFGSRAFGVHTASSDHDYIVHISEYHNIKEILEEKNCEIQMSEYYLMSFYVKVENDLFDQEVQQFNEEPLYYEYPYKEHLFNIVTYCDRDQIAWETAIEMLKVVPKSIMGDKNKRQLLFETNLAMLKKLK